LPVTAYDIINKNVPLRYDAWQYLSWGRGV